MFSVQWARQSSGAGWFRTYSETLTETNIRGTSGSREVWHIGTLPGSLASRAQIGLKPKFKLSQGQFLI